MRVLPLYLLALARCSSQRIAPTSISTTNKPAASAPVKAESAAPPVPVKLYKKAEDLVGKPFRDLGEVSGGDFQSTVQDLRRLAAGFQPPLAGGQSANRGVIS